jgi:hypothetical protein
MQSLAWLFLRQPSSLSPFCPITPFVAFVIRNLHFFFIVKSFFSSYSNADLSCTTTEAKSESAVATTAGGEAVDPLVFVAIKLEDSEAADNR